MSNHPVVLVTWHDAIAYCDWLNETLTNWKDVPKTLADRLGQDKWRVILPSEAEWEKAARGSDGRIYPYGNEFDLDKANTRETGIGSTSAVGCFPNGTGPYGLLDMSGNVWEWTRRLWGKAWQQPQFKYPYDPADQERESMQAPDDVWRVVRGGSWLLEASGARVSFRDRGAPVDRGDSQGFRCVLRSIA